MTIFCPDTQETFGSYAEYITQSAHWKKLKHQFRKHPCFVCGSKEHLQVHHRTYERLGQEEPSDLVQLCGLCHEWIHDLVKDGKTSISRGPEYLRKMFRDKKVKKRLEKKTPPLNAVRLPQVMPWEFDADRKAPPKVGFVKKKRQKINRAGLGLVRMTPRGRSISLRKKVQPKDGRNKVMQKED